MLYLGLIFPSFPHATNEPLCHHLCHAGVGLMANQVVKLIGVSLQIVQILLYVCI